MSFYGLRWGLLCLVLGLGSGCTTDNPSLVNIEIGDPDAGVPEEDAGVEDEEAVERPEGCRPDQCAIDKLCVDNGGANPDNPCEVCLVVVDIEAWSADDGGVCDDGDACTSDDACVAGSCQGVAVVCDDGNGCTDDVCDPETGACVGDANEAACDDGDPCTVGDVCGDGACQGGEGTLECDDGNGCTTDTCEAGVGCVATPEDGLACDDGDPCTLDDVCAEGSCQGGGGELDCDDENICTVDGCAPGEGCVHEPIDSLCADENPCTDELCDPERGCLYPFNEDPCDDGSLCTETDRCQQGACLGDAVSLDDGNLCTDLSCDPDEGVSIDFNDLPCDDNNACTVGDVCAEGGCEAGVDPLDCDDENVCTDDACDPASGCVISNNTDACDDGNACTVADVCGDGACGGSPRNCDDGNACTDDSCAPESGCLNTIIISNTCRPTIEVEFPPRAATIQGTEPTIVVQGQVSSGAGPITSLLINGQEASVQDGGFSLEIPVEVGGNILVIEAEDALGSTRRKVQSFLWSEVFREPGADIIDDGGVEEGLGLFLSAETLDDGDRSLPPNDLATIFGLVLDGFDISSFFEQGEAITSAAGYDIYLRALRLGGTDVSLVPLDGVLGVRASLNDIDGDLFFDCDCSGLGCLFSVCGLAGGDSSGGLSIASIGLNADLDISVNPDHTLSVSVNNTSTSINNLDISSNNGWTNFLLSIIEPFIIGGVVADLETELNNQVSTVIGPLLEEALGAFALDTAIGFPSLAQQGQTIPVRLKTAYNSVDIDPEGMTLAFEAGAFGARTVPYTNLGSLGRVGCLDNAQTLVIPGLGAFEMVLSDDLLGQLLHGAWRGGLLEFDLPPELLGDLDLTEFGVTELELTLSGMLQPTASDCNEAGELLLHVGDLRIDATMRVFGEPLDVVMFASLKAGLTLRAQEDGIGLAVEDVEEVELEINVVQEGLISFEAVLGDLIEANLIPALLDLLGGDSLGSFPLPAIDLSDAIEGINEPLLITIVPQTLDRSEGNTIVSGALE